ncbi:hypothetical protein [Cellulomonas chengniuliangii]|uniref:Uncharacterized protein n=1 Tax=Cellulomonas chengniuliangii TaxID=2968084 RepID=A0ABY5L1S0_9CELL|nr:hypothetical protein [Cellulomonas chengniuliangii]MCC2308348.1 hypothetical protein [Cellulomonas chengniuliangii]UUI76730.1 hypothetical protein NP064_07570 [Cellulomonas chengniuliangii]
MTTEPFFDEFHRLQPDIPVVLLPPAAAAVPVAVPDIDPATAAMRAAGVRQAAGRLLHVMWPVVAAGTEPPSTVRHGWEPGVPGTVRARAAGRVVRPAGLGSALPAAGSTLIARGWHVTERALGATGRRLTAELDDQGIELVEGGPERLLDISCTVPAVVGDHVLAVRRTGAVDAAWGCEAP